MKWDALSVSRSCLLSCFRNTMAGRGYRDPHRASDLMVSMYSEWQQKQHEDSSEGSLRRGNARQVNQRTLLLTHSERTENLTKHIQ